MIGASPLGGPPEPGPRWQRLHGWRGADPRRGAGRATLAALLVVAVAVQGFVWGSAPATGDGGALLPGLRSAFGLPYAVALVAVEVGYCLWFRLADGAVVLLVAAALVDLMFWAGHLAGARFALDGAASMTGAFGVVVLAAWLWRRHPTPGRRPRGGTGGSERWEART